MKIIIRPITSGWMATNILKPASSLYTFCTCWCFSTHLITTLFTLGANRTHSLLLCSPAGNMGSVTFPLLVVAKLVDHHCTVMRQTFSTFGSRSVVKGSDSRLGESQEVYCTTLGCRCTLGQRWLVIFIAVSQQLVEGQQQSPVNN